MAMKRQTAINEKLMRLQRKEMTAIREWMTNTEDKISRFVWRDGSSFCLFFPRSVVARWLYPDF